DRVVQLQEVHLVGSASVRGKRGDEEIGEVTHRTATETYLPVDDGESPLALGGIKQQVIQVEIPMEKRLRVLSKVMLHGYKVVSQLGTEWHNSSWYKDTN